MLDKASKRLLEHLDEQPGKQILYGDDFDSPDVFKEQEDFFAAVRFLEEKGLVEIIRNQNGSSLGVLLSHTGRRRREFSHIAVKRYLVNQLIGIIALFVAVGSLVISLLRP